MPIRTRIEAAMRDAWDEAGVYESHGSRFIEGAVSFSDELPQQLRRWVHDPRLGGFLQHESRAHMASDLHRYMFVACFARLQGYSPKLGLFPPKLLPDHANMHSDEVPFIDRFRVQLAAEPASTVVSHICKDGHYFIHPDAAQCRSLTVREAARLQTFLTATSSKGPGRSNTTRSATPCLRGWRGRSRPWYPISCRLRGADFSDRFGTFDPPRDHFGEARKGLSVARGALPHGEDTPASGEKRCYGLPVACRVPLELGVPKLLSGGR
jgi:hypothetical protein